MIDIHCHILPAIDDGPQTLDEALEMARIAVADGVRGVVATPHVNGNIYPAAVIRERVEQFNEALAEAGLELEVIAGADTSALLPPRTLCHYTINGGPYVLFEFPHTHLPANAGELVFNAAAAGLRPIITHPERNPDVVRSPQRLFQLIEAGALVQITAESLTGGFGVAARECALFLLRRQAVHFLASDAHSPRQRRPVLSQGLKAAAAVLGETEARRLVTAHPAAVLAGHTIQ